MTALSAPSISYAHRLGRAAVRTTELSDSLRDDLFPIPRKYIDCGNVDTTRRDDRNPFLKNADFADWCDQDLVKKLGLIEPSKRRAQNSLKKVLLYDNVTEQRRLELNLIKITEEEKRVTENIAQKKAEIMDHNAKARAAIALRRLHKEQSRLRPKSEPAYGRSFGRTEAFPLQNKLSGFLPRHELEKSSKSKSLSPHQLLSRKSVACVNFPVISKTERKTAISYFENEDFRKSKNYFGDVTKRCLADGRFQRLHDSLIPPEVEGGGVRSEKEGK
ncbi:hypothetical protein HOLleu_19174 [Holothuria leucospilota]|uniref:Uncharacterized protein n=1 Tax=Holothuria leucospilota TaxID=206669 RepID=A0A9Q1H770_HOLLE|nr:hypothetical protein HOLleu_19174 [Holothuria leucospilota]